MNAVIAEDDFTCRCWLRGLLKKQGISVAAEAANGNEAISAVATHKPDLLLLDVSMPVRTGPDALPEILKAHSALKVIMLTSIADEGTVRDCLEKGAIGYLRKDSPIDQILALLKSLTKDETPAVGH